MTPEQIEMAYTKEKMELCFLKDLSAEALLNEKLTPYQIYERGFNSGYQSAKSGEAVGEIDSNGMAFFYSKKLAPSYGTKLFTYSPDQSAKIAELEARLVKLVGVLKRINEWDMLNPPQPDMCHDLPWLKKLVAEALKKDAEWKPIDTAPKDGTYILVNHKHDPFVAVAHWGGMYGHFNRKTGEYEKGWVNAVYVYEGVTKWKPIPKDARSIDEDIDKAKGKV